jgi:putative inorganic carbon (HCO3(-)) transporter
MSIPHKLILGLYCALMFAVPLVLWPFTSEVFEFNKIVLTYLFTVGITATWMARMVAERKLIFRRTLLDIPLLVFLSSQVISTLVSVDFYTSLFGYYSRFNGGLVSTICYILLYFGFTSNFNAKEALKIFYFSVASAFLVALYGILEHFGIDKEIWVQDVQSRVFSTLGQPNWLAAYVTALIPVVWAFAFKEKLLSLKFLLWTAFSIMLFWTLIFTKSRSGLLAMGIGSLIFWLFAIIADRHNFKKNLISILITVVLIISVSLISGTQFTPSVSAMLNKPAVEVEAPKTGTALESGGTESGIIRKIVWKGAWEIFRNYPLVGTGVETFAYTYYKFRPAEHNLTSEWDFIYNKAHNEFLNYAATTGSFGLLSYLAILAVSIILILKTKTNPELLKYALAAGIIALSVSNFFGFSVVPTQLQLFLFPAFAVSFSIKNKVEEKQLITITPQKIAYTAITFSALVFLLYFINYWRADMLYSVARSQNSTGRPDLAIATIGNAINLQPNQAIYFGELASSYSTIAMAYEQSEDATNAAKFSALAQNSIENAVRISPANINIRRQMFGVFVRLSTINEDYLVKAKDSIKETIKIAPTDAKLHYNLGIAEANLNLTNDAINSLKRSVELKPNYADARIEYAALLVHLKRTQEAKSELQYVLEKIDPGNEIAKQALANLN